MTSTEYVVFGGNAVPISTASGVAPLPVFVTSLSITPNVLPRQYIVTDGYTSSGDGGGGTFVWNATDTRTPDGGTIVAVSGVATGRWNRVYSGPLNVLWFGAVGDGVTDNYAAFHMTVAAKDALGGGVIAVPALTFALSAAWDLGTESVVVEGAGWTCGTVSPFGNSGWSTPVASGSILRFTNDTHGITCSTGYQFYAIRDLIAIGPGVGTTHAGLIPTATSAPQVLIDNVLIANFAQGYNPGVSEDGAAYNLAITGCSVGIAGLGLSGTNWTNLRFFNTSIQECADAVDMPTGSLALFYGGLIQSNTRGVTLRATIGTGVIGVYFDGTWFENNGGGAGPDFILDSSSGPLTDIGIYRCRLASDTAPIQWSGSALSGTAHVINGQTVVNFSAAQSFTGGQKIIFASQPGTTYTVSVATTNSTTCALSGAYGGTTNAATVATPGNQGINFLKMDDCLAFGSGAETIPAWVGGIFSNINCAAGIVNNGLCTIVNCNASGEVQGSYLAAYGSSGPAGTGDIRIAHGPGLKAASALGAYDVSVIACDAVDEVMVGDSTYALRGDLCGAGKLRFLAFGGGVDATDEAPLGTKSTQSGWRVERNVYATTANAGTTSVACTSIQFGASPGVGHGWRFTVEWSCRNTSSGAMAAGTMRGVYSNANGVEGSVSQTDDGHNSGIAGAAVALSSGPDLVFTPPGGYSGTLDWSARVRIVGN